MNRSRLLGCLALLAALLSLAAGASATASAAGAPEWRLEDIYPPAAPNGVEEGETGGHQVPVALGRIGDIEFWGPDRGLLITEGNGSTIPPGLWFYNGKTWHELAKVCGASDGRIAWASESEFWTVSDGRSGQAANGLGLLPPLEDNTLCQFSNRNQPGEPAGLERVVKSYATPGFQASSYQAMHSAACLGASDCWFGGDPLPQPQPGAFELHWNGKQVEAEPDTSAHAVDSMQVYAGSLYESLGLPLQAVAEEGGSQEALHPTVISEITPEGAVPFRALHPRSEEGERLPVYPSESLPAALGYLHLSADEEAMWAGAGPVTNPPRGNKTPAQLTLLTDIGGVWSQVLGPNGLGATPAGMSEDVVNAVAAEPGTQSAWIAADTQTDANIPSPSSMATLVHISSSGNSTLQQIPTESEQAAGVGPKGAAYRVVCPATNDCWMATTQGWLFHLSETAASEAAAVSAPEFEGALITSRPTDESLPQIPSDAPPADTSGSEENEAQVKTKIIKNTKPAYVEVTVPLMTHVRSRLVHGTTLELSFQLTVKAELQLIARRHSKIVARTPLLTMRAGRRRLLLQLNRHAWPTKLNLKTRNLVPLLKESAASSNSESISTTSLARPLGGELGALGSGSSL